MRLKFLDLIAALFGCVLISMVAAAQSFPTRPIRLIVPFPPAGITDLSARLVAEGLRVKFNQPVIVENKPGANGLIGLREMLKTEPDGYTLMAGTVGNQRIAVGLGLEHLAQAEEAVGAGLVLDDHRLVELDAQALGHQPRGQVGDAGGRERDDQPD